MRPEQDADDLLHAADALDWVKRDKVDRGEGDGVSAAERERRDAFGVEPIGKVLRIAPSGYRRRAAQRRDPSNWQRRNGWLGTTIIG
ncbi:hypothetical protein [Burkholderia metallica]